MKLVDLDALGSLSFEQIERLTSLVVAELEIRKQMGIQNAALSRLEKLPAVKAARKLRGAEEF